ncbi:MAG: GAF and ANTAR domain-containing protein [Kibdelosporangium sp.]
MSVERRRQLLAMLAANNDGAWALLRGICGLYVSELAITGAWLRVLGGLHADNGGAMVYATDPLGVRLDDLQQTAGQGPCTDAFELRHPVLVPDLAAQPARWLGFTDVALGARVAAVFAFPLQLGAVRLGMVGLYRDVAGALTPAQLVDALLLADTATGIIIDDLHGLRPMTLPALVDIQADVHQASGMVAVQLEVSLPEALLRIRGYAYAHGLPLAEVAGHIIGRRLRLDIGE